VRVQNSKKLKYLLRCSKKSGVSSQLHLFLRAEFVELKVFGNTELEWSYKKREQSSPKHLLRRAYME
jgi:hypothetical protein